jgi:glycosyltransferase involved in cell wall biosynthesis
MPLPHHPRLGTFGAHAELARTFLPLPPRAEGTPAPGRPARVCIATPDVIGPIRNGGIGTAYTALADALAEAGHEVTILYLNPGYSETGPLDRVVADYRARGIAFVPLPETSPRPDGPEGLRSAATSYAAYAWLRDREFDAIHFPEWRGLGFYSTLAKSQGLAFGATMICLGAHSPSCWHRLGNGQFPHRIEDLETDHMERTSVALADVVWSSSQYLLNWMLQQGWALPDRAYVQPYIAAASQRAEPNGAVAARRPVDEIVFFGRLESRKGLPQFCDAIDRLADSGKPPKKVAFLGKPASVQGTDALGYIARRAARWSFPWEAITDRDSAGAIAYLSQPGRMAAMPSLTEVYGLTILECALAGVPFVAASVGGIPEVVYPEDRPNVLCPPIGTDLAERFADALGHGGWTARPAVDPRANAAAWVNWHAELAAPAANSAPEPAAPASLVSVILTHKDRPQYLARAVESLQAQSHTPFEVILIDDGSEKPEAIAALDRLEPTFEGHGWRILRGENRGPGAARNAAAREAKGEYLLFMDDDNLAKPNELEVLVRAATRSGTDILSPLMDIFAGTGEPAPSKVLSRWLYLGSAASLGALCNVFGDTNSLFRASAFRALGGFAEDRGVAHEDWELFAKAALRGFRHQVVPEALFWYRTDPSSNIRSTQRSDNHAKSLRPYLEAVPEPLRDLVRYAQGTVLERPLRYRLVDKFQRHMAHQVPGVYHLSKRLLRFAMNVRNRRFHGQDAS